MKKKEIILQLKEVKTFDEAWILYKECLDKFTYRILRQEILETALELSDKLYQTERISLERLTIRLSRMVFMQMLEQTKDKLKLKAICLYSEIRLPGVYLQAIRKREKLAEEHKDFNEAIRIALDVESHPRIQDHVLLLAVKLAKTRKDCREIIGIAKKKYLAYDKVFEKMNRLNY